MRYDDDDDIIIVVVIIIIVQVAVDRSVCPDIHWCYRLYYKSRRAQSSVNKLSVTPDVYTEQQITGVEQSLRECVEVWCRRLRQSPETLLPVCERLVSESEQVITYMEKLQKRATRLMVKDRSVCYEDRLRMLALTTLEIRRLVEVFKIFKGFDNVTYTDFYTI